MFREFLLSRVVCGFAPRINRSTSDKRARRWGKGIVCWLIFDAALIALLIGYLCLVVQKPYTMDTFMRRFADLFT